MFLLREELAPAPACAEALQVRRSRARCGAELLALRSCGSVRTHSPAALRPERAGGIPGHCHGDRQLLPWRSAFASQSLVPGECSCGVSIPTALPHPVSHPQPEAEGLEKLRAAQGSAWMADLLGTMRSAGGSGRAPGRSVRTGWHCRPPLQPGLEMGQVGGTRVCWEPGIEPSWIAGYWGPRDGSGTFRAAQGPAELCLQDPSGSLWEYSCFPFSERSQQPSFPPPEASPTGLHMPVPCGELAARRGSGNRLLPTRGFVLLRTELLPFFLHACLLSEHKTVPSISLTSVCLPR